MKHTNEWLPVCNAFDDQAQACIGDLSLSLQACVPEIVQTMG